MNRLIENLFHSILPYKSADRYLIYRMGECPVIISAPHGGNIKAIDIPSRTYGNRSKDTYTKRLIQRIVESLDKKPYFIYSDIHRSRVDLNRDIKEAAQGNKKAEEIWRIWNNILGKFTNVVSDKYNRGLYIDLHSHNRHDEFEIGYDLKVKDYLNCKLGLKIESKSSMYALKLNNKTEYHTLFGESSIFDSLSNFGYNLFIPSRDNDFLNGGYNINKFSGNKIGAIQIECPISVLKYDLDGIAVALSSSIEIFYDNFLK